MRHPARRASAPRRPGLPLLLLLLALGAPACEIRVGEGDRAWNDRVAPYRHEAEVDGTRIHFIDMGSGTPVILVHGYADSTYSWHRNLAPLLAAGFRVIPMDQPGLGRSGNPPPSHAYSVENQAAAALGLADRLGLERFCLVGHSMGGGIALYITVSHPGRVLRTAVIDPACYKPPNPGHTHLLALPGVPALAGAVKGRYLVERSLEDVYFHDDQVDAVLVDEYARPMNRKGYFATLGALSKDYFSEAFLRMTEQYGSLGTPLLIVWGEEDTWVPPAFGDRLHRAVPGSRLETIAGSGHNPHQEAADAVNALLLEFLAPAAGGATPAPASPPPP